jgi:hypothetical protein
MNERNEYCDSIFLTILNYLIMRKISFSLLMFLLSIAALSVKAQVAASCIPDHSFGVPSALPNNTGNDIFFELGAPGSCIASVAENGGGSILLINSPLYNSPSFQVNIPGNDPDVIIQKDFAYPCLPSLPYSRFLISVVYESGGNIFVDRVEFLDDPSTGWSTPPITVNSHPLTSTGNCSNPNIAVNAGGNWAVVSWDCAGRVHSALMQPVASTCTTTVVGGVTISNTIKDIGTAPFPSLSSAPYTFSTCTTSVAAPEGIVVASGYIQSDVDLQMESPYFTFTDQSQDHLFVQAIDFSYYFLSLSSCTGGFTPSVPASTIQQIYKTPFRLDKPRIACSPIGAPIHNGDWTIVTAETPTYMGASSILSFTGFGLTGTSMYNLTYNNATGGWPPQHPLAPVGTTYDLTPNINKNPVVSYNNYDNAAYPGITGNEIQIAWESSDPLVGAGGTSVAGVFCKTNGLPYVTQCGLGLNTICEQVPYNQTPTGIITCGYGWFNNIGSIGNEFVPSVSGKNSYKSPYVSYYDAACGEINGKYGYDPFNGFREAHHSNSINNSVSATTSLNISPNPFTENIKITSTNNDAVCNLIITDISGRQIVNTTGNTAMLHLMQVFILSISKMKAVFY